MDLNGLFGLHWRRNFATFLQKEDTILLGASGGLDSTVLAHLFRAQQIPFVLAHMNFGLRGEESVRDEQFVRELARQLNVSVLVKQADTKAYAASQQLSTQEAARDLRYKWFGELMPGHPEILPGGVSPAITRFAFTATAHHADDSVETMLMHFFRGTGIEGLRGIPAFHREKKIIRPLLPFTREQLEKFAADQQLRFVTDSSNLSSDYTRNYFRNQLIPQLQEVFPHVKENLLHNIERLSEAAVLYQQAVQLQLGRLMEKRGNEIHIPVLKWLQREPLQTITWEMIRPYGFSAAQTREVMKLADAANGSTVASATHRIIRNRAWLIIAPLAAEKARYILIEQEGSVSFEEGSLTVQLLDRPDILHTEPGVEWLDADRIAFPLLLRKWKTGDYFYPLGMTRKKKLSKFFIDAKLSKIQKEAAWVLESGQKIICVPGLRIDNRFKYTDATKKLLKLTYQKK
ncbi:MAG TPA: tRNA lysidine(34) synthetase TilS [Sediminibacterium sp.]|nr:tRNA lysidine(34) synthetase TilS [Sediminibacterium sp.]